MWFTKCNHTSRYADLGPHLLSLEDETKKNHCIILDQVKPNIARIRFSI